MGNGNKKNGMKNIRHLSFDELNLQLAQIFINIQFEELDSSIVHAMQLVAGYCHADRAAIYRFDPDHDMAELLYEWAAGTGQPSHGQKKMYPLSAFDLACLYDSPFACSLTVDGKDTGTVVFDSSGTSREWTFKEKLSIQILSRILPNIFYRKEQETAFRELNEIILDSIKEGVGMYDRNGCALLVNRHLAERFGKTKQECIGVSIRDLLPEDYDTDEHKKRMQKFDEAFASSRCVSYETTWNGRWYNNRFYPVIKDGKVTAVTLFSSDMTDKKIAEMEARRIAVLEKEAEILRKNEAEQKKTETYKNLLYETTGKILSCTNPREEIQELCTKVMDFLDCQVFFNYLIAGEKPFLYLNASSGITSAQKIDLEYLPIGTAVCGCVVRDGCRIVAEHIQSTEDDMTVYVKALGVRAYACHPLMADGNALGSLSFGSRTRDRFSEEDLLLMKTVADSISVAVKRKQDEETLLQQAKELMTADKNKNEFLSALSHELRNPLATIAAGLSLLDISQDREQQKKAKTIMQRQMEHLCHLVDDLLDITRITRNKIVLKKELLELSSTAGSVADDMKALFEEKGVRLEKNLSFCPVYISADPVRIRQIIGNLLHNALKFTNLGCRVTLCVYTENNWAQIYVEDNGIGIAPDFMPSLFEPFTQANESLDRGDGGLGLGLSIVRAIVELHGGRVSAYSEGPGKGSRFAIFLPLSHESRSDLSEG